MSGKQCLPEQIREENERLKRELESLKNNKSIHRATNTRRLIDELIIRLNDEQTLLQEICRLIVEETGYKLAWFGIAREDKTVQPVAYAGFGEDYLSSLHITWDDSKYAAGPAGQAIKKSIHVVFQYITENPDYAAWNESARKYDFRASAAIPVFYNDRVFGALNIYAAESGAFGKDEMDILLQTANDISIGISNIRQRKIIEKQTADLILAKEKVEEKEKKFHTLFDSMTEMVVLHDVITDENGEPVNYRITECNKAFTWITGIAKENAIGQLATEVYQTPVAPYLKEFTKVGLTGEPYEYTDYYEPMEKYFSISVVCPEMGKFATITTDITDINRIGEALKKNQAIQAKVIENIADVIVIIDKEGINRYKSPNLKKLFGWKPEELIGRSAWEIVHPDDVEDAKKLFHFLLREPGATGSIECRYHCVDGAYKWIEFSGINMLNDPDIQGVLGNYHDISDRKLAEVQLIQSNSLQKAILESSPDVIVFALDKEYRYLSFNTQHKKVMKKIWGEEIVPGMNMLDVIRNDRDKKGAKANFDRALAGESFVLVEEYGDEQLSRLVWQDYWSPIVDGKGEIIGLTCFVLNITELQIKEQKLQSSEQYLKETQTIARLGTYILDVSSGKWESSEMLDEIFGIDEGYEKDIKGWKNIMHLDWREIMSQYFEQHVIGNKEQFDREYKIIRQNDQTERWVHGMGKLTFNEKGQPVQMVGTIRDITEQKEIEILLMEKTNEIESQNEEYQQINEELVQTNEELYRAKEHAEESDRLKTAFLQNISHEIRTPMNGIMGFAEMINKPGLSENKRKSFTNIIISSSNQLLSIVTNILTISSIDARQERVNMAPVCINSIIVDLLSIFKTQATSQNLALYAKQPLTDRESEILADETKITQVLSNLLTNALKFTHQGFIEFGYVLLDRKEDGKTGHITPSELQFYVKDTGIGVPGYLHEKIFERFRQVDLEVSKRRGGSGLGLSISKGFVELMDGKIWVESEPDKGSVFYFTIPYQPVHKSEENVAASTISNRKKTVLVAEDEEYNYLLIEEYLIDMDVNLIHAKDGAEAVDICMHENIDLVLMDIKMPVMDGHSAAKKIKKKYPKLPVIAQSAYALEHEIEKYEGIFDDYLTKPVNVQNLRNVIVAVLGIRKM